VGSFPLKLSERLFCRSVTPRNHALRRYSIHGLRPLGQRYAVLIRSSRNSQAATRSNLIPSNLFQRPRRLRPMREPAAFWPAVALGCLFFGYIFFGQAKTNSTGSNLNMRSMVRRVEGMDARNKHKLVVYHGQSSKQTKVQSHHRAEVWEQVNRAPAC